MLLYIGSFQNRCERCEKFYGELSYRNIAFKELYFLIFEKSALVKYNLHIISLTYTKYRVDEFQVYM